MTKSVQSNAATPSDRLKTVLFGVVATGVVVAAIISGRWFRTRTTSSPFSSARTATDGSTTVAARPVDRGEIVFQVHCAKCHGPEGHGDPEAMQRLRPPPRDFASRPWRFEVSLDAIRNVTVEGIPATAMPAHRAALSASDLDAVVAHTYQLATTGPIVELPRSPLDMALLSAGFVPEQPPRAAPELTLSDAAGNKHTLAEERGRVALLNFWGASCEHCLAAMPTLQSLTDQHQAKGLSVLNVCADADSAETANELVNRVSPRTHVWIDETGLANSQFEVHALPTIWLVGPDGKLLGCARGMKDWSAPEIQMLITYLTSR